MLKRVKSQELSRLTSTEEESFFPYDWNNDTYSDELISKDWDTSFLATDDDQNSLSTEPMTYNAPDYSLNGGVPEDYGMYQVNRKEWPKPMLRSQYDYAEWYDMLDIHSGQRKKANTNLKAGDWVEVIRPERYAFKSKSIRHRVGEIVQTMNNGWYVIRNLKGDYVGVFCGPSQEDGDLIKIDFEKLSRKYKISAHVPMRKSPMLFRILNSLFNNLPDSNPKVPDDNKDDWLLETPPEYG